MVEPPGIAPGSGPLITSAFIAIVRANPDRSNIGCGGEELKGRSLPAADAGSKAPVVDHRPDAGAVLIRRLPQGAPLIPGHADALGNPGGGLRFATADKPIS